jgi:hypothetical protein
MTMSRNPNGTSRPFFDEIGTLFVTSPSNVTRSQNYWGGWQVNCAPAVTNGTHPGNFGSQNGGACDADSPMGFGPIDVSTLFGTECGVFTVRIEVWNGANPFQHSTCYLRGS